MAPLTLYMATPPSVNAMYINTRGPGKRGRAKSKAYEAWCKEPCYTHLGFALPRWGGNPISGPVSVDIQVEKPKRGRSDVSNRIKACEDRLVSLGVLKDDSQIVDVRARWAKVVGCVATITEAA